MMYVNKIVIIGRLASDPEVQTYGNDNKEMVKFPLVCSKPGFAGRNRKSTPIYVNIVTWGRTAEFVKNNLTKGDMVLVDGELSYRTWEDKLGEPRKEVSIASCSVTHIPNVWGGDQNTEKAEERAESTSNEYPGIKALPPKNAGVDPAYAPRSGGYAEDEDVPF